MKILPSKKIKELISFFKNMRPIKSSMRTINDDKKKTIVFSVLSSVVLIMFVSVIYDTKKQFGGNRSNFENKDYQMVVLNETKEKKSYHDTKIGQDYFKKKLSFYSKPQLESKPSGHETVDNNVARKKKEEEKAVTRSIKVSTTNIVPSGEPERPKSKLAIDNWHDIIANASSDEQVIEDSYSKTVLIKMSDTFRVKLLKQAISSQINDPVIVKMYSSNPDLNNALLKGQSYIVDRSERLFIQFSSITLTNGESYPIDAGAMGDDNQNGIEGFVDDNIDGDILKGFANGILGVGSAIIDSQTAGIGSGVISDSSRKPLEKIETNIVITLERGKRFKVFFNSMLKI